MLAAYRPTTIVWEAPLPTSFLRGRTNSDTTALLFGLAAVVGLTAWREGFTDLRIATPAEVRVYFIGTNMRRAEAKAETKARCRALGWTYRDDNEADALALWAFMCSLLVPAAGPVPALPGIIRAAPPPRRRAAAEPGLFGGKHGP